MGIFYTLITLLFIPGYYSYRKFESIVPKSFINLTPEINIPELEHAFDNDYATQTLFHSDNGQQVTIALELPGVYQIKSVEIISDVPAQLKQTIHIGFSENGATRSQRLTYECLPQATNTLCQPSCYKEGNSREGVVGNSIIWTVQRTAGSGWTRIYDVLIMARSFEQPASMEDKSVDISFLKPYFNRALGADYEAEQCAEPVWKLTDSSEASSKIEPVSKYHRNVTIFFGQAYSITKVAIIASELDGGTEESVLRFEGRKSVTKHFNLKSDCTIENESIGLYVCWTPDLAGYPFKNVTIDAKGLVRVHIYGMQWYYPSTNILAFTKAMDPDSKEEMKLQCVASTCEGEQSKHQCDQYGHVVQCAYLELARTFEPLNLYDVRLPDTVLVTNGRVKPEVAEVIPELRVLESSNTKLVTSMPRTHAFYGQYKCICQTDDPFTSVVESAKTSLSASEFDQDLVFDRNYTAELDGVPVPNAVGFLEMPATPSYFSLTISGHSLTEDLQLRVTYLEGGQFTTLTEQYARTSSVQAFPHTDQLAFAWPIKAYKIVLDNAWPDVADEGLTTIAWETKDKSVPLRQVKDELRTIVISPKHEDTVRAWVWRRDSHVLDIRAHYQQGKDNNGAKKLYIQRTGCSSTEKPEHVSSVTFSGNECRPVARLSKINCIKTKGGFAVQFIITNPSASDSFSLYEEVEEHGEDKRLAHSPNIVQNLESELNAVEMKLKIIGMKESSLPGTTQMDLEAIVDSRLIIDNSACRPTFLSLHPSWPVDEKTEQQMLGNQIVFTLPVPDDQQMLTFSLDLRIEGTAPGESEQTTKRSLQLMNPRHMKLDVKIDDKQESLTWPAPPESMNQVLEGYDVKMWTTNKVCGVREEQSPPPVKQNFEKMMLNEMNLGDLPNFKSRVLVDYEVEITPTFKSDGGKPIRGLPTNMKITKGKLGRSRVEWDRHAFNRTARVYVIPSQPTSCQNEDAEITTKFNIQYLDQGPDATYGLDKVHFEPETFKENPDFGRWYTITGLQPGRRYDLKATVVYPTGIQDEQSTSDSLWTTDEVSVSDTEVYATPGERVVIRCVGAVGPDDSFKKQLEWKRADGTQLPDGTRVETTTGSGDGIEIVSLIFEQVESGQSNQYACFIKPSIQFQVGMDYRPPSVKLIVNVLELDMKSHVANFTDPVTVQCRSHQGTTLFWESPDGMLISEDKQRTEPYVTNIKNEQGILSVLHIPSTKLGHTGQYLCKQEKTNNFRGFTLKMHEDVRIGIDEGSSRASGEKLSLTCHALLGNKHQQIEWFMRPQLGHRWTPIKLETFNDPSFNLLDTLSASNTGDNAHRSTLRFVNSPASAGEYACALAPVNAENKQFIRETTELPHTSAKIQVIPDPVVKIGRPKVTSDKKAIIKCDGYPAHAEDRLQWFYVTPDGSQQVPIGADESSHDSGDEELAKIIKTAITISDTIPPSWPGSDGPVLLAASRKLFPRNAESTVFTPETLELTVSNNTVGEQKLMTGTLVCRYRRPRVIMETMKGELMVQEGNAEEASLSPGKSIQISQLFSADERKEDEIALASSGSAFVNLVQHDGSSAISLRPFNSVWALLFVLCSFNFLF